MKSKWTKNDLAYKRKKIILEGYLSFDYVFDKELIYFGDEYGTGVSHKYPILEYCQYNRCLMDGKWVRVIIEVKEVKKL